MKKTLLLLLFLLPFLGVSQVNLVKWDDPSGATTANVTPAYSNAVSAENLSANGISFQPIQWEGFKGSSWPFSFSIDENKYFQVTVSAKTGYKIKLGAYNFTYKGDGNLYVKRYQVRYSKDDFATSTLLLDEPTQAGKVNKSIDLSKITLYAGEKLTLRIYGYKLQSGKDDNSPLFLMNRNTATEAGNTSPTITGTVSAYDPTVLNANDDLVTTQEKRTISFNPLTNDTNTAGASITFTQPSATEGTVSRNGNIFTFAPATNFKGTSTFTYTLTNGARTSTATVVVYVTDLSPKLIIWNGILAQPKAVVTDPNITGNDITGTGFEFITNSNPDYFNVKKLENGGSTALTLNRYVQMSITPKTNYKLTLTQFNFIYNSPSGSEGASMFEVHYSTDPTFPGGGTVLLGPTTAVKGADTPVTLNFPTGTTVSSNTNQTFYIRIYPYAVQNLYNGYFKIKHDYGGEVGPTLTGIVEPSNLITANPDTANTNSATAINIPILANDENYTPLASINATQPTTGGSVVVNGTTNVTFTPTAGFVGTTTFEYTISNGTNYSTTTVTVNVTAPPCTPTGDQTSFGSNAWIGYVYKMANNAAMPPNVSYPALPSTSIATYIGNVSENKNFDRNIGGGSVTGLTSNFACDAAPSDRFFVRYKMLADITEAGVYSFDVGSDDGVRLYIDDAAVPVITRWNGHGFTMDYATQNLTVGQHKFVLEYYEDGGDSRVSFFIGIQKGNPTEYGDKVWNVYGYVNNDITLQNVRYAGYYVDPHLNPDSTNYWPKDKSPSSATIWQGSQVPDNNFTVVYKRKGFDCGLYQLKHMNHDDAIQLYIDDKLIFSKDGWDNATYLINGGDLYPLNSESRVEIRLREDGGDANLGINFTKTDIIYNGTGTIPNGSSLVISANTELKSDITVCSCTINPNITLTVPKDVTLTVDENVNVGTGGKLLILDGGSFLQTSTSKNMFTGSNTAFQIERTTKIRRFDLTYWSSPITSTKQDGFMMKDLSPETLFDKYSYWSSSFKWATDLYGNMEMKPGIGYSIRGPQSFSIETPAEFTGKFFGTPNNGDIPISTTADKYLLIGNPYPSAIDGRKFITDNGDVGALYFWTHVSLPKKAEGSNTYKYSSPDYAVFTLLGATRATTGGETPSGYIGVGQGFFIKPKVTSVKFNNGQRIKAQNSQFFKTTSKESEIEVNRLWLNLSNTDDAYKQILIGYAEGATNSFDYNYDAVTLAGNTYVDFYTINEAQKLSIQARSLPFDNTERIPLGYKSVAETQLTISIDHADGFFNKQAVYLEDKTTGTITDLRASNYTFKTGIGTFTDRFVLRYTNKTLGTDDFENVENGVLVSIKSKVINAVSGTENIKEVQIYTIGGQLLYNKSKIDAKELEITNLHSSNQVLLVKVMLENGHVVTKKIIFN
ncbi:Ig-like domain-containing protein [Flavobacterium tyrosinilyticum]|uniref:Ig-like domain-containing protein n=1 Tax=Flavobacterium tyrosinilyticum TaxID=1658740 RepID=UPI002030EE62|nr:cadherin-like domain-containing protein [Flavobacterium tyrosinilyticum]MCM0665655.1 cadherin-like domain-containing protein [Flavobacterium tyrosinilyticum]